MGPRALGHRSILGDPRRADMKAILNSKIKRRESFRPFAPSVLRDHVAEWFELDGDVPTMMQVVPIREEKRPLIPAVCHVDGTGRLQTVTEPDNGPYARLIQRFYARTGVPMLLNTSDGLRPTSSTTKTNRSSAHPISTRLPERPGAAARAAIAATEPPVRPTRLKAPARPGHLVAQSGADPRRFQSAIPRMP